MRVGDLERASGLTRDIIHHYVRVGLIPAPEKSNATVSWFDERHLEALRRVRAMKARGLSLAEIKRLLDAPFEPMGIGDLDAASSLLSSRERPSVAREALTPEALALVDAMGFAHDAPLTSSLVDALTRLSRSLAVDVAAGLLARSADAVERSADASMRALVSAVTRRGATLTSARDTADALGDALSSWRAMRERARIEGLAREVSTAAREARRAPWLSPAGSFTEGAALRLVVLDRAIEAAPDDLALHRERLRLTLATAPSSRAGSAAREALSRGLEDPWISLALGVSALDSDACEEAVAHFERARAARPSWSLAEAFAATARLYGAARAGDGVLSAGAAIAGLEREHDDLDDALDERLRARLVAAQTLLALPPAFAREHGVIAMLRAAVDEAAAVPVDDLSRGTGALARVEGNALLSLGDALTRVADDASAREAWSQSVPFGGRIAFAARARLRSATKRGA